MDQCCGTCHYRGPGSPYDYYRPCLYDVGKVPDSRTVGYRWMGEKEGISCPCYQRKEEL